MFASPSLPTFTWRTQLDSNSCEFLKANEEVNEMPFETEQQLELRGRKLASNGRNYKFKMSNLISPTGGRLGLKAPFVSCLLTFQLHLTTEFTHKPKNPGKLPSKVSLPPLTERAAGTDSNWIHRDCLSGMSTEWLCRPRRLVLERNAFFPAEK